MNLCLFLQFVFSIVFSVHVINDFTWQHFSRISFVFLQVLHFIKDYIEVYNVGFSEYVRKQYSSSSCPQVPSLVFYFQLPALHFLFKHVVVFPV